MSAVLDAVAQRAREQAAEKVAAEQRQITARQRQLEEEQRKAREFLAQCRPIGETVMVSLDAWFYRQFGIDRSNGVVFDDKCVTRSFTCYGQYVEPVGLVETLGVATVFADGSDSAVKATTWVTINGAFGKVEFSVISDEASRKTGIAVGAILVINDRRVEDADQLLGVLAG